jgi:uncharacterized membrane protein YsdA (DUF1294 family)
MEIWIYYLVLINLISFIMMYYDKRQSKRHGWRVPESRIFIFALIFGSVGVIAGMQAFRHKTKHAKFVYGIPAILIAQVLLVLKLKKII